MAAFLALTGLSLSTFAWLCLVSLGAGILKTWIGFGPGILMVGAASLLVSPQYAAAVWALMDVVGNLGSLFLYWGKWETRGLRSLAIMSTVGVIVGALALRFSDPAAVRKVLGLIVIASLALDHRLRRSPVALDARVPGWVPAAVGLGAGTINGLGAGAGPIFATYFLLRRLQPAAFVGTMSVLYLAMTAVKIGAYSAVSVLTSATLVAALALLVVMAAGLFMGRWLNQRMDAARFHTAVMVMLLAIGILLLF